MDYYSRYYRTLTRGDPATARGITTIARHNVTFSTSPYTTWRRKNDNPMIGVMEGLQFIAGVFYKDEIARIAPNSKLELFTGMSSYGPRCGAQPDQIVDLIRKDRYTRQAVIVLANPGESPTERPCTTSLQFQVSPSLHLMVTVTMRSSDAVWGLPYDLIQFNFMGHVISTCTGYPLGEIIINIGNAHVYESTALKIPRFSMYEFTIPTGPTEIVEWKEWALKLIPTIDYTKAVEIFNIRKVSK